MSLTRLSSKGQIIIPLHIREQHHWQPGLEFNITDTGKGLLLTPLKPAKSSSLDEVVGCVHYKGKKKSLHDMEKGIRKGALKAK